MGISDRKAKESQSASGEAKTGERDSAGGILGSLVSSVSSSSSGGRLSGAAPQRNTIIAVAAGMIMGMITAYMIFPTEFSGAAPRHMSNAAVEQWVRMIAVGHSEYLHYDDANARLALQQVPEPQSVVARLERNSQIPSSEREAISSLKDIDGYGALTGAPAPVDPGLFGSGLQILLALAVATIGTSAAVIAWRSVVPGDSASTDERRSARASAASGGQVAPRKRSMAQAAPSAAPAARWPEEETEKSGLAQSQHGALVLHAVSNYVKGQNYDESFAIELGGGQGSQFLGECGVSTATKVGSELQAVEFWGFDMASQETVTKVFAAPAAVSDPALIAAVGNRVKDPTTDIVAATAGAKLIVDAHGIQLQAEIKSVVCNFGGGAPNSGIESLQIEIMAWRKQSLGLDAASAGAMTPGDNPFADYSNMEYSAEQMASPAPPPTASGQFDSPRPKSPQSAKGKRPEDEEDDPFGGTGNFMPYS